MKATVFCRNCKVALCRDCDGIEHLSEFMKRHHRFHVDKCGADEMCSVHPDQPRRFFCFCSQVPSLLTTLYFIVIYFSPRSCCVSLFEAYFKVKICDDCAIVGEHVGHHFQSVESAAASLKEKLSVS